MSDKFAILSLHATSRIEERFDLEKAEARMHILDALVKALSDVDRVIQIIRDAKTPDLAKQGLIETYEFTEIQARAILTMQLQKKEILPFLPFYLELESVLVNVLA